MKFNVHIWQDEDGVYIAKCPIIPGCVSQGATFEESVENIKDAILGCIEERQELGLPPIVYAGEIEVEVPADLNMTA
jgi:predicted RNase H-like HicB family nuclease